MNSPLAAVVLLATLAFPLSARAQSCASTIALMANKWQTEGLKTTVTVMSHQANGISGFSGARPLNGGSPQYEARLVWNGNWMTTAAAGGTKGLMQYSDRYTTAIYAPERQNFSVESGQMSPVDLYLSSSYLVVVDSVWGNVMWIANPRCENGVIWGLGDPIGNFNGDYGGLKRKALYVFSYGFSSR